MTERSYGTGGNPEAVLWQGLEVVRAAALDQALAERDRALEVAGELAEALRQANFPGSSPDPTDDRWERQQTALARYEALKEEAKAQAPKPHEQ